MMHSHRRFCLSRVDDPKELAEMLTERTWTCCSAFQHGRYLFLNDATCEDGAQEYAVFKKEGANGKPVQIESITFSWMNADEALQTIREIVRGQYDSVLAIQHDVKLETPQEHGRCRLCM